MERLKGKTILLIIPKSQFCETELEGLRYPLKEANAKVIVLSKNGQESLGVNKTRFQPDGILADWDKQPGVLGKYDAVFVLGGKGSAKSLWEDSILPQILTDHYRAGKMLGAIGTSVVVLVRAGLAKGSIPAPNDRKTHQALKAEGVIPNDIKLAFSDNVLIGRDANIVKEFAQKIEEILDK